MRFLLFSVPHVENSYVYNSDASQLSAAFNPDIFPPFKEILKILSPQPLSLCLYTVRAFLRILPFNLLNEFTWLNFVSAPL